MSLSGQQRQKIQEALINAFPNMTSLEQMLSFELNKNLRAITPEGSLQHIVFALIQAAESQGWLEDLIRAARTSNPGNKLLSALAVEVKSTEGKKSCLCQAPPLPAYFVERPEHSQKLKKCLLAESTDVHWLLLGRFRMSSIALMP